MTLKISTRVHRSKRPSSCFDHRSPLCGQVMAHEENQKYKEGKYILERAKMMDLYEGNFTSASEASTVILGHDMEEVCS